MKKIIKILFFLSSVFLFLVIMGFSFKQENSIRFSDVKININPISGGELITSEEIMAMLNLSEKKINLDELEQIIDRNPFVKKSQVYHLNQQLFINVIQENPIFRIVTERDNYLVTQEGKNLPISKNYSPHLLIVYAPLSNIKEIIYLITKWKKDNFYNNVVYDVSFKDRIVLSVRTNNYKIHINNLYNIDKKLDKFKKFALLNTDSNKENYSKIDLSFDNQIICAK